MQYINYEVLSTQNPLGIKDALISIVHVRGREGDTSLHWHSGLELTLVLKGAIQYMTGGKQYLANAGDIVFINSSEIHKTENVSFSDSIYALVCIIPDSFIKEHIPDLETTYFALEHSPTIRPILITYLQQIVTYLEKPAPFQHLLIYKELLSILYQLCSKCYSPDWIPSSHRISKKSVEYVNSHYMEEISIKDIASYVGLQDNYFCRYFKNETGFTFHQYLSRIRLDAALALLSTGEHSALDCALACGFSSEKLLINWCHKIYHCTPLQYVSYIKQDN